MGMVIHDDFWEACKAMPEKQRAPFLYALALYRFEKKEPKGNPTWLPTFIALKQRIDMGDEASERGRKMAQARWGKRAQHDAPAPAEQYAAAQPQHDAQAHAQADAQAHAQASNSSDAEVEDELEVGVTPYSPPMPSSMQEAPFWLQCLGALNEITGFTYTTMPEKCRHMLDRSAGNFTVEQVRKMIAYKRDEWNEKDRKSNTSFSKNVTPQTLFSPDHFEQYMHQTLAETKEANDYAAYDQI